MVKELGGSVNMDGFEEAKQKHSELSRSGSEQKFKGGLADKSEQVVKYHTATHLLHQALYDVLGSSVQQEGSNITGERLRFDFRCDHKPTPEDIAKVSYIIQSKIQEALPVNFVIVPKAEAEKLGAKSFFKEKYPDMVKVYFVGQSIESAYSKEFCGGPHVTNTNEIGTLELYKTEKIGKDLYRVYAKT
jgi:alanyl-tRNA synthetase